MVLITLCMIVKNEEDKLEQCLKSIVGNVDEIIIVDTGSMDGTKEIAYRYTDNVYDFEWTDDFAAARNFSISKAGNEHVLMLDSDEITEEIDMTEIKRLIADNPGKIGRLLRINEYTRKGVLYKYSERVNRLFSKKNYHYEGIIHEQVVLITEGSPEAAAQADNTASSETYPIPLTVRHSGYEGDIASRKKKTERNIRLLQKALITNPEDPYLLYQLGKSYYMAEDYINACDYFGKALYFDLNPKLEYVQDMVESYGYALINSKQYETALQLLNVYDEFSASTDFVYLAGLIYMNNAMFDASIREFRKAAGRKECKMDGVNSYLANYNIGIINECLGKIEEAKEYYKKCGDYKLAKNRLEQMR
jgi:glycosyltransferase involved in cell wall biosynthesis